MVWRAEDPQGDESAKVRWELVKWTGGRGLDIGCGPQKAFPHFIGLDNNVDAQLFGIQARPDIYIDDAQDLRLFATEQYDFVFSSHLLEHIPFDKVVKTLKEWLRVLKVGGYLLLYLPDETLYPKVGEPGANKDHKWNVSYQLVVELMQKAGFWDLIEWERRDKDREYSLYFVFQKKVKGHAFTCTKPKPEGKTAGVVRYGAYGDLLQASSVVAGLKEQGYHVTLYCSPPGCEVLNHDPNIDSFYYQGVNQVPNAALTQFWDYHKKKYDRWVNLSESVEGQLLSIPDRAPHQWTPAARHRLMNHNYLEMMHEIAGLPHVPRMRFYPTPEEVEWAKEERARIGSGIIVVWAMSGSSVHKKWPWTDTVMASMLLEFPQVKFVLVGGPDCVLLEQGWFKVKDGEPERDERGQRILADPRVQPRAGDWSIRQTLSFCQQADVVVGPETGVLNAVAQEPMPKVVFLSHSTDENLTRDWVETHVIVSEVTSCPGRGEREAPACHQLHYGWTYCKNVIHEGEPTGCAQCMWDIPAEHVAKVLWHVIQGRLEQGRAA
jgi:predicted SAM-dependent methyltransferase/ADP-heptose:LPS heptosyltransferase